MSILSRDFGGPLTCAGRGRGGRGTGRGGGNFRAPRELRGIGGGNPGVAARIGREEGKRGKKKNARSGRGRAPGGAGIRRAKRRAGQVGARPGFHGWPSVAALPLPPSFSPSPRCGLSAPLRGARETRCANGSPGGEGGGGLEAAPTEGAWTRSRVGPGPARAGRNTASAPACPASGAPGTFPRKLAGTPARPPDPPTDRGKGGSLPERPGGRPRKRPLVSEAFGAGAACPTSSSS